MPIVARRSSEPPAGRSSPSAVLLPTDGAPAAVQPPASWGSLAAEALGLLRRARDPHRFPATWSDPAFVREVALVRAHLGPIRSRAGLAASYGREAFHSLASMPPVEDADADAGPGAVRVAYAIRWLELGDGSARPAWPAAPLRPGSAA
jgi:hypothetical protein